MQVRTMRLAVGVLLLVMGSALFARDWLFPEFAASRSRIQLNIAAVFAVVFGCVNLARWYAATQFLKSTQTAVRYPLQPDPSAAPQVEPIPEFDFSKQPNEKQPEQVQHPDTQQ
jgi:hypothetical protein